MKKALIFIAAAAIVSFAACTKTESTAVSEQRAISFQTIAGLNTKAINGTVFPTTETFSTYAWADGTAGPYFMDNVTIAYFAGENLWKAKDETYYWPKNATVDFISYYPTGLSGIAVTENTITYSGIDVDALQEDIMYADKAVGLSDDPLLLNEIEDGVNAFTGVPTIFRHATAKVNFKVALTYKHKEEADGTVTDWKVTVNSAKLSGINTKGGAVLTLSDPSATGVVGWDKPADNVWTPDGTITDINGALTGEITPGTVYTAVDTLFVLPQALVAEQQKVTLNVTVETTRNGAPFLSETFDVSANIRLDAIPAWEMNHIYTYMLMFAPTSSNGNGGSPITPPSDPSDPNYPGGVDPDDPNLDDAIITFDPAVDGWENVGIVANIAL